MFCRSGQKVVEKRKAGETAILVKRSFEKYVHEVHHEVDNIVLLMLDKMVLTTKRNVCLCAAYVNPLIVHIMITLTSTTRAVVMLLKAYC